jgi:hypothetical protein
LANVISGQGIVIDPMKIEAIQKWPSPLTTEQLHNFLGLAGYSRKFVRNFGIICKSLTKLLKKNILFIWTDLHDHAFSTLKTTLVEAPVLVLPNFAKQFQLETNASDLGGGVILMQKGHPLAFIGKAFSLKTKGLSIYEKEYLTILIAVDQWRSHLHLSEFVILTDQESLTHLSDQRLHTF